jgi:hypothetical protein
MPKYTGEIENVVHTTDEAHHAMLVNVSVYGDLPGSGVKTRTRNAIIRAALKVASIYNVTVDDWEEINYRAGVTNGVERHTVTFNLA